MFERKRQQTGETGIADVAAVEVEILQRGPQMNKSFVCDVGTFEEREDFQRQERQVREAGVGGNTGRHQIELDELKGC